MKRLLKILVWILGIWAVLTISAELILSSKVVTRVVNRYASEYIDGDMKFGRISFSMLKHFPNASLELEDFSVTYPADRYEQYEQKSPQGHLLYGGCGDQADTLASFRRFMIRLDPVQLILGKIRIPEIELTSPRIFAHRYEDTVSNWNMIRTGTTVSDTISAGQNKPKDRNRRLPRLSIGRIRLYSRPHIVYTDSPDTLFAMISMKQAGFNGRLTTGNVSRSRIGLHIDSLFIAGRASTDTIALGLERLYIHEHGKHADFNAKASALAATRTFGRIRIPLELKGTVHFPKDTVPAISVHDFNAEIAAIPLNGEAHVRFMQGKTGIKGNLSVNGAELNDILRRFVRNFIPEVNEITTDALAYMDLECDSEYVHGSGSLPECRLAVRLPESYVRHRNTPHEIRTAIEAQAYIDRNGKAVLQSGKADILADGIDLNAEGSVYDIFGKDPQISIDGHLKISLDSLHTYLPDTSRIEAGGNIEADIKGKARLSHLSLYTFSQADLTGNLTADQVIFRSPEDTVEVNINSMHIGIGPETMTSRRDSNMTFRLIGITGNIGSAAISMKESLDVKGEQVVFSAKNSTDNQGNAETVSRFGGKLSAEHLSITDVSGNRIELDGTDNGFQMIPKRDNPSVPVLTLSSRNKRITVDMQVNRGILTDASIKATAAMNTAERRKKMRMFMDSLATEYPGMPKDSLRSILLAKRMSAQTPEWMKEEDFRQNDIRISLDESLKKYFRDWDLNGNINIRTGILMTPYFPNRNILRGCDIDFTNDGLRIDSLKIMSGKSEIAAKGRLDGLRRAILGRGGLKIGMDITSNRVNANEILAAFNAGSKFDPSANRKTLSDATDAEFFKMVTIDTLERSKEQTLVVVPGNLDADIHIDAGNIIYSDLNISRFHADLTMKERCIQITNTTAGSNIGEVTFEGFYATRTKKDIRAGFNFNFKDITAEKAISLMPAVDTIMPLLKSFGGQLNCDLAATASLDPEMNIITPSINGIIRISGDDLTISDSDIFTALAKKLKFNNRKTGNIRHMTVEGVIQDNILEVFPFVINLDRYTLALSGKQNLDKSFRYHASLIKSPILIKLGVDLYGPDFDNMKFKIGKPKYKNEKVPVFSTVIDQTKINLAESIRNIFAKGVDTAIKENEKQAFIEQHKQEIGYINAVDMELEELSEEEQKELEEDTEETTIPIETETDE